MNKKSMESTDIVFLLDRSGSMSGAESDTIGGYNSYLERMKKQNVFVTTVLFDDKYDVITERKKISKVNKLDNKTYYTRGSTALMDAIGKTINYMDTKDTKKVLFIITTDGMENSSKEYNKSQVKELILGHNNWEFVYIGANIDSYSEASTIGIKSNRVSNYTKSKKGIDMLFSNLASVSEKYCDEAIINDDWKDGME